MGLLSKLYLSATSYDSYHLLLMASLDVQQFIIYDYQADPKPLWYEPALIVLVLGHWVDLFIL